MADRLIFHTPTASLGIRYLPVSAQLASAYNIPAGARVRSVVAGSPAALAGLKADDIITAVDGQAIDDSHDLKNVIEVYHIGDRVKLSVFRGAQTITITVTLGSTPS